MTAAPDLHEVRALADRIEERDGAPPLSDQALSKLSSSDVTHFEVRDDNGGLSGYAQLDESSLEIAADPEQLDDLFDSIERLTHDFEVWSHGQRSAVAAVAERRGYLRERVLLQLRRAAGPVPKVTLPGGVQLRAFVPGQDEQDWLEINAAAFAGHEQGRMGLTDLLAREHEEWFDPDGFLLAVQDSNLIGYHWTKIHRDGLGEVYVLGVGPASQGMGLGKSLLYAGLEHLGQREILLYVDESNEGARRLYAQAGFTSYDVDVQLRAVVV